MTHFTVMVQIPKGEEKRLKEYVAEVMAPYDENKHVKPYIDWSPDIARNKLATEILNLRLKVDTGDNKLYNIPYCTEELKRLEGMSAQDYFEERAKYFEAKNKDTDGNVLTTYNPNSKWDWYEIGGRWEGMISDKNGNTTNVCRVGDIDWEAMRESVRKLCRKIWDGLLKKGEMKIDEDGRAIAAKKNDGWTLDFIHGIKEGITLEEYVQDCDKFSTWAVLTKKGIWIQRGRMGWWAISSDEVEDEETWGGRFKHRFIKTLDEDDWIALVDCHI